MFSLSKILKLLLKDEQQKNPRMDHIVYRVMYQLGYRNWVLRKVRETKRVNRRGIYGKYRK